MKTNKEWHEKNVMPKNPTIEQRFQWHKEHAINCGCRPISDKMRAEFKKKGLEF